MLSLSGLSDKLNKNQLNRAAPRVRFSGSILLHHVRVTEAHVGIKW